MHFEADPTAISINDTKDWDSAGLGILLLLETAKPSANTQTKEIEIQAEIGCSWPLKPTKCFSK